MVLHERLSSDLQATAVSEEAWPEFLFKLADLFGATEATLGGALPGGQPEFFAPRTDLERISAYREIFHQQNAIMRAVVQRGPGAVTETDALPEITAFQRSDFYNLWCVPQGFNHGLALNLSSSTGWLGSLVINTASEVTSAQVEQLRAIAPELSLAVERWKWLAQLRRANQMTLETLDMAGQGALFLNRRGTVLDCNQTAHSMLTAGRLRLRDGHLAGADDASGQKLASMIGRCLDYPDFGGGRVQIDHGGHPLTVQCAPCPADLAFPWPQRPAAIVVVTDPQQRLRKRIGELAQLYELTRAEIELAIAIVETGSRKTAAQSRGVSDATARAQLTSIFDKTGVRRQTELVRLLLD